LFDNQIYISRPYLDPVPILQQDNPYNFMDIVTIEKLMNARVHFGHKVFPSFF